MSSAIDVGDLGLDLQGFGDEFAVAAGLAGEQHVEAAAGLGDPV